MSKYDAYLTEVVYEIDDVIYDFYRQSNEIIATKRNQDRLLDFRDKTMTTLNDMNVRSLEIISQLKDQSMVEQRVDVLINKNASILESALTVLESDHSASGAVKEVYQNVYEGARKMVEKANESETVDRIKAATSEGLDALKDTIHTVAEDPRFIDGVNKTKTVAKDVVSMGSDALKESSQRLKEWLDSRRSTQEETPDEEVNHDAEETAEFMEEPEIVADNKGENDEESNDI